MKTLFSDIPLNGHPEMAPAQPEVPTGGEATERIPRAAPRMPETMLRKIRVQNALTRRDLPYRLLAVIAAHLLSSHYLDPGPVLGLLAAFMIAEAGYCAARRSSDQGSYGGAILLLASGLCCATSLTALAVIVAGYSSPVAATLAVAILVTSLGHCVIVRTAWLPLGIATAFPFVAGLVVVVADLVPVSEIAAFELAIGAAALAIGSLYVGQGIWEMSTTRSRLMQANDAAESASRARSRFFTAISHEMRTPLNAICGMAEMIAEEADSDCQRRRADLLLGSARALNAILSNILDQSRLDSGKHELHPRPGALRAEIESATRVFEPEAIGKGLDLCLSIADAVPRHADFDPQKLRQVITNLVSNAIKYTDAGSVAVSADASHADDGWHLAIEVSDTGRGIPPADRDAIFVDYERLASDETGTPGTGLGLSISRRFARMMGGDVVLCPREEHGATFRFTAHVGLAADARETPPVQKVSSEKAGARASQTKGRPSILVVDDTATNRYVVKYYLRDVAGRVDEAENGREALALIEQRHYDAVLLDLHMPVLDGAGMLAELRAGPHADLPVILLTASASADASGEDVPDLGEVGAILGKPVRKDELISQVRNVIRGAPARAEVRRLRDGARSYAK